MKARNGQIALFLLFVLVVIVLLTLLNVDTFLSVRAKNRVQNAGDAAALAAFAKAHHLLAITADATLASAEYVAAFNEAGVPLFVHTVNGAEVQKQYYDLGVTCVYTDYAN